MLNPNPHRFDDESPPRRGTGSFRGGGDGRGGRDHAPASSSYTTPIQGSTRRVGWADGTSSFVSIPSGSYASRNLEDVREASAQRGGDLGVGKRVRQSAERDGGNGGGPGGRVLGMRVVLNDGSGDSEDDLFVGTPSSRRGGGGSSGCRSFAGPPAVFRGYAGPPSSAERGGDNRDGGGRSGAGGGYRNDNYMTPARGEGGAHRQDTDNPPASAGRSGSRGGHGGGGGGGEGEGRGGGYRLDNPPRSAGRSEHRGGGWGEGCRQDNLPSGAGRSGDRGFDGGGRGIGHTHDAYPPPAREEVGGRSTRREEASPEVTAGWGGKPWRAWGGSTPRGKSNGSSERATPKNMRPSADANEEEYPEEDYVYPDMSPSGEHVPLPPVLSPAAAAAAYDQVIAAVAYHQALAADNASGASGGGGAMRHSHSPLSRVSRGIAAAPGAAAAAAAAADGSLIELLESSIGRIQILQTTLGVREAQLAESKGALEAVQHRLVSALAAVGDDMEAVDDLAGANAAGVVERAANDARERFLGASGYHQGEGTGTMGIHVHERGLLLLQYEREMKRMAKQIEKMKMGMTKRNTCDGEQPVSRIRLRQEYQTSRVDPPGTIGDEEVRPLHTRTRPMTSPPRPMTSVPSTPDATASMVETGGGAPPAPQLTPASITTTPAAPASFGVQGLDSPQSPPELRAPPSATLPVPGPGPFPGSGMLSPPSPSPPSPLSGLKPRVRWQNPEHLDLENVSTCLVGLQPPMPPPMVVKVAAAADAEAAATLTSGQKSWSLLSSAPVIPGGRANIARIATSAMSSMARSRR